jgi:CRISPR-associated endonuclease/helicase Cas3
VFLSHPDFFQVLDIGAKHYDLMPPPKLKDLRIKRRDVNNLDYLFKNYHLDDYNLVEKVLIASVKSCLMASDLSGSALPRVGVDPEEWLQERLFRALSKENLLKVVDNRLRGQSPLQFQQEARDSDSNTIILEAGCGSGKTAAAYYWASSHADGKRLFFCYPTTGTASEGFSGYLSHRDDFDATLIHSRARIDYRLLSNMPNHSHEENELRLSGLEALETWPIPAVVCTAHTVLGLLENVRRGLYAWPSLVQSVFVFDEIHSFSERLFDYLLVFLRIFVNTPVLLMTATLPQKSRELLEKACADRGEIQIIRGPADRENSPRYEFSSLDREDAINEAKRTLSNSGKVLWVSNTVARTMEIVKEALDINLPVQPYHSRYRYRDRLTRQRKVIDGFKPDKPAMLAVTTQVAEMSLDISADLLITDLAPVPSLIQRLGRLNRYEANPAKTKKAIFLNPENLLPYASKDEERDLRRKIAEWLRLLSDRKALSQKDLFDTFQQTEDQQLSASCRKNHKCDWLDGLHISRKSSKAIEESGHTVEVVMEEDLENGDPVEFAIPMPIINSIRNINKFSGRFLVAPKGTIDYDEFRGAKWKK